MSYRDIQEVKFELTSILTWGVVEDKKYGGYSIPIMLDAETASEVRSVVEEHGTKDPVYGSTMYLKSKRLTETQTQELLGKGRCHVEVRFAIKGVCAWGDTNHLIIGVSRLRRVEDPDSDSCPED